MGERLQNVGLYLANWRIPSAPLPLFPVHVPLQGRSVLDHRGALNPDPISEFPSFRLAFMTIEQKGELSVPHIL